MNMRTSIFCHQDNLLPVGRELKNSLIRLFPKLGFDLTHTGTQLTIHLAVDIIPGINIRYRKEIRKVLLAQTDGFAIVPCQNGLAIIGNSKRSVYYGIYTYLREAFGVFYDFHKDIYPKKNHETPIIKDFTKISISSNEVRMYKPQILGDYSDLHSPWAWDMKRWKQCIKWCVRSRFNHIQLMLFNTGNWLRYNCAPEALEDNDRYMTTGERIALLCRVIKLCHQYGLKVMIGFCTNASTFAYLKNHPEHETTELSPYVAYLCWDKAFDHLMAVGHEMINTYSEADAFVLWPHENGCQCCDKCKNGDHLATYITQINEWLIREYPEKKLVVMDWHFPKPVERQLDRLPQGMPIINMHKEEYIPLYHERGMKIIHCACVANWDGTNCTTISPNLAEMAFRAKAFDYYVIGFEAHHVSMFSGEYTINAYGDVIWNPAVFVEENYRHEYCRAVYDQRDVERLMRIYELLSSPWTVPFSRYFGSPLYDVIDEKIFSEATVKGGNSHYENRDGMIMLNNDFPSDHLMACNMYSIIDAAINEARKLSLKLVSRGKYATFLKTSITLQWKYLQWIIGKYRSLLLVKRSIELAREGEWDMAMQLMPKASTYLEQGRKQLESAYQITKKNPKYFHVRPGICNRGWECAISDLALKSKLAVIGGTIATIAPSRFSYVDYKRLLKICLCELKKKKIPAPLCILNREEKF